MDGVLQVRQSLARLSNQQATDNLRKTRLIFQEPKTDSSKRTIPIPEDFIEELKCHKSRQAQEKLLLRAAYQNHGLVFCLSDWSPLEPKNFTRHFDRMLNRARLPISFSMMPAIISQRWCGS
jgi:integrase